MLPRSHGGVRCTQIRKESKDIVMMKTRFTLILCGFILVVLPGCGNQQVQLSGKVTFSDDGSPLTVGTVNFINGSFQSRAPLQPDGTYTVGTYKANDGLPPGKYKVFVAGAVKVIGETAAAGGSGQGGLVGMAGGMPITEPLIDPKFAAEASSALEFEAGSAKTFNFTVDRYVGTQKR